MADVSVKMGVSGISQFKSGINDAQASVKTFDAALKANEKQLKATGNAENYMQAQTTLLNGKLKEQEKIAKNAEQALKQMEANGVKTTSAAYQNMQRRLIEAQSAMLDTQMELDNLGAKAEDAGGKADKLGEELGGLNKKVSLEQVTGVVDKLTQGMENAAKKAVELGQKIWDTIMDTARRADDTATMAQMYGIDLQKFKQMQALVTSGMDTSVDAMLGAQDKLTKGVGKGSKEVLEDLQKLGLAFSSGKDDAAQLITDDTVELFWKAGKALMEMDDAFDKEATAQTLFGKSWKELKPLFDTYDSVEEYNEALEQTAVSSEEATQNAAELADRVAALESTWTQLKDEIIGAVAPGLSKAMETLEGLLARVLEYLQTPEGKKALEDMGAAVAGLFTDLSKIDPEEVVAGFTGVFNTIVGGLQWLNENKQTVIDALKAIVLGWGGLQLTGGALQLLTLINGIRGLGSGGVPALPFTSGSGVSTATGVSFMTGLNKAMSGFSTFASYNGGPVWDWLTHESDFADVINGNESIGDYWERKKATIRQNASTFWDDWANLGNPDYNKPQGVNEHGLTADQERYLRNYYSMYNKYRRDGMEGMDETSLQIYNEAGQMLPQLFEGQMDVLKAYMEKMKNEPVKDAILDKDWEEFLNMEGTGIELPVAPKVQDNAAQEISDQVGTVIINGVVKVDGVTVGEEKTRKRVRLPGHVNGLWSVPFDGYTAVLHKDEQIVPARQAAASRNFSSNLYVESMYMNNGTDAEGLAAAMAAAQRRTMSGYGSGR